MMKESDRPASDIVMQPGSRRNQLYKWKQQMTKQGDVAAENKRMRENMQLITDAISVSVNRLWSISMDSAKVTRNYVQLLIARQQARCTGIRLVSGQSQRWADCSYLVLAVGGA